MSLLSAQFSYGGCSPSRPCQTPEKQALYYYLRARILLTRCGNCVDIIGVGESDFNWMLLAWNSTDVDWNLLICRRAEGEMLDQHTNTRINVKKFLT